MKKLFRYLFVWDDGLSTLWPWQRTFHIGFTHKNKVQLDDFDFMTAEEIGQMMGGN